MRNYIYCSTGARRVNNIRRRTVYLRVVMVQLRFSIWLGLNETNLNLPNEEEVAAESLGITR